MDSGHMNLFDTRMIRPQRPNSDDDDDYDDDDDDDYDDDDDDDELTAESAGNT
jgi:hypothetical protein